MSALFALILVSLTAADIVPIAPGPGDIFNAGAECVIKWTPDASASWTNMTISMHLHFFSRYHLAENAVTDLMSGSNSDMQIVSNVDSEVDGTDASLTPYSWRCPEVNPYSSIYFYQVSWYSIIESSSLTPSSVHKRSRQEEFQVDNTVYGANFQGLLSLVV